MILGAMRIYPGSLHFLKWTLPQLLKITDHQLFMLDRVEVKELPAIIPPRAAICHWKEKWDHYSQMNALFREVDTIAPRWVVYPDSDEILPVPGFHELLGRCIDEGKLGVSFPYAEPFGGFDYQIHPSTIGMSRHLKILLWKPGLTFLGTPGFCVPAGYWGKSVECREPLLHLRYMTETARRQRATSHPAGVDPHMKKPSVVLAPDYWSLLYRVEDHSR